jgi:hypothetical protein
MWFYFLGSREFLFLLAVSACTLTRLRQIATIENELRQFRDSHTANEEYKAYRKFTAEKTTGALKDKNEFVFNDQLKGIQDVDVDAVVTVLPSSIQSYMESYYAGKGSIVDEVRETKTGATTTRKRVSGDKDVKATDNASTKSTDASKSPSPTETAPGNSTTTAPVTSTILILPSTTSPNSTASSTSSATSNGASQPTGVLKAAGAVVVWLAGVAALVWVWRNWWRVDLDSDAGDSLVVDFSGTGGVFLWSPMLIADI